MTRPRRPTLAVVLPFTPRPASGGVVSPPHQDNPPVEGDPAPSTRDDRSRDGGWTVHRLADDLALPAVIVARVARDLGYTDLVFDHLEAAAIVAVLRDGPPPRAA